MELADALRELQGELAALKVDEIPNGWHTAEEWAEIDGRAKPTVAAILLAGYRADKIERRKYCIDLGGLLRKVWHYKVR